MERTVFLLFLFSSALLEVRCLECYVCDNCANVKLKDIQTCGPTATSRPSTSSTTTMKPLSSSTGAAEILTTLYVPTTTDPIPIVTKTATESTLSPTTITTDSITTLTTTTETSSTSMSSTTEAITTSTTTATTPFTYSTTAAEESTTSSTIFTMEPRSTTTVTTVPTSSSQTTKELEILSTTLTEPGISTLATANENTTTTTEPQISISFTAPTATLASSFTLNSTENNPDPLSSFTTTSTETTNERTDTVSEPIISYLITTKLPPTFTSLISDLGTLASFTSTEPSVQTMSSVPKIAEPLSSFTAAEPVVQTISSEPTITAPIASMSTESTRRPNISVAYPQRTSANIAKPVLDTNVPYNIRRIRSVPEGCLCTDEKCDCPTTHHISKRYAVRGLALSKNIGKYVCVVDKYKINETEVTKRGCAMIEEDEQTSCMNAGFGPNCKVCDTDQCNSAAILQSSILMMFTLYLVHSF